MRRDLLILTTIALALVAWLAWQTRPEPARDGRLNTSNLLNDAPESFRQVTGPRPFEFPADHAAHPGYRNEWWYFTGNLDGPDGDAWGFQFTLFRFELDAGPRPDSAWTADAVWMAHLALSDADQGIFHQAERFARGALDLAGATEKRWWLRDWQVTRNETGFQLEAGTDSFGLDLAMEPIREVVRQGDRGYSQKGPQAGNASHYYSITRLKTKGAIQVDGETIPVDGLAWLDREWGSSQLAGNLAGWDWFSLQLDDGRDLMVYRLRTEDGEASRFSAGKVVYPDGDSRTLGRGDFTATPQRDWQDSEGHQWPVAWRVEVPSEDLNLAVEARFDEQRWSGAVSYWEGAVGVRDAQTDKSMGRGYLELSGYAE
ncbi:MULTISPECIES: lipocalin-like domain-containing protein [unclassified Wenzhouxiangella]|uniref:lipocalin-like domain-containing protein n=1 Tax=unclassified Wenzhouxiangella TaxID=2613841 RepID=UPI000E32B34B|nr:MULTISPECIES: lipocalin-like domain-containing protein [unclassified Wenzhouxiangella]RFF28511.1 carotenoid 1,2-hydratase [Wenzhouxiangella sp. 15181]RFP70029.1 carotenoid 1,2-hydratase [Wenzhouxiangella sp. 15190]